MQHIVKNFLHIVKKKKLKTHTENNVSVVAMKLQRHTKCEFYVLVVLSALNSSLGNRIEE